MKSSFRNFLSQFDLLTESEIEEMVRIASPRHLNRGDYLIQAGMVCQEVAFVVSGVVRSYYHTLSGEEVTYCFRFQDGFLAAYSSFISQKPTSEYLQAISPTELLVISKSEIHRLENSSVNFLRFFKFMAEQEFIAMEARIFQLQQKSSESRYRDLIENHPEYLHLIPLNHLASYIGVTQRHLSRIRGSIRN
ncbi:Crp/Fnr family transcriptional regulator [Pontibacter sp. G13]|uniref:Crp/Fnr family transcriptional regulator n=1 Tax=Pontibacter sp. G13 TaxID=3074898 RepID=UPI00288AA0C9|nr:Crp/Fnr family transcriptional regulator [Pontibacter sp. G13]WNJ17104.1 Crp/Fnr family transcriptional regulator [Pontibacter sp. G13]